MYTVITIFWKIADNIYYLFFPHNQHNSNILELEYNNPNIIIQPTNNKCTCKSPFKYEFIFENDDIYACYENSIYMGKY